MAVIPVNPFVLRDVDLYVVLDPDGTAEITESTTPDFAAHTSSVQFAPSSSSQTWNGLKLDAAFTEPGVETWAATLDVAQDWKTPNSLSRFLFENAGKRAKTRFVPQDGGPSFDASVTLASGAIGGAVNAFATSSVTLGVNGRPTLVAPTVGG